MPTCSFVCMTSFTQSNHITVTKSTMVMTGIVLFFTLLILMVFLWSELRLQKIQQTSNGSVTQAELYNNN